MMKLHKIADQETGWLHVIQSMIEVIPMADPLGPATIILLLDDCPLPTKETVAKLPNLFNLSSSLSKEGIKYPNRHRNMTIVLGCIAEKLAGPSEEGYPRGGTLCRIYIHASVSLSDFFCKTSPRNADGFGTAINSGWSGQDNYA